MFKLDLRSWLLNLSAFLAALFYCLAVLVLGGGSGIWVPAVMPSKVVGIDGLTTFVMATLAPIAAEMLIESIKGDKKYSILYLTFLILLFASDVFLAFAALLREKHTYEWELGWSAVLLSLFIWMIIALKSGRFHTQIPISNSGSIGGETTSSEQLTGSGLP